MIIKFLLHVADFFRKPTYKVKVSQSYIYNTIAPAMPILDILKQMKYVETQARKFEKSLMLRVFVMDNEAYWIKNNAVFVANMVDENNIDKTSAKQLDMISMDEVQLKKITFVIEKLTEGLDK
jgi:hypothetical protein